MVDLLELRKFVRNQERLQDKWRNPPSHVASYIDQLKINRPEKTSTLIMLPPSRQRINGEWSHLIAIARFRTQYSVIEELAKLLTPVVVDSGVIPFISPIAESSFETMKWESPIIKNIKDNGFLIFDKEYSNE